jgi:NADPH:quinone reductase-like Zn-dependent oxidoreductase
MKTSYREIYGGPEVVSVRQAPMPTPADGGVVVKVHAATVNRTDCAVLSGSPYVFRFFLGWPKPRSSATGTDFAGEVVAVGPGAAFAVGDRVMGFNDNNLGSHAQFLALPARDAAIKIPGGVSYEAAAASIEGAHYARNFINKIPLKRGDSVLVYGATGAIGSASVALLKTHGALVTAVCPREHHPAIVALGADAVFDYRDGPFTEQLQEQSFDWVFDAVGKSSFGQCRPLLKSTGAYISSELGAGGQNLVLAMAGPVMRGPKVKFPVPTDIRLSLTTIADLLVAGGYAPLIDRHYALDDLAKAFAYVGSGQKVGSVLLSFAD